MVVVRGLVLQVHDPGHLHLPVALSLLLSSPMVRWWAMLNNQDETFPRPDR